MNLAVCNTNMYHHMTHDLKVILGYMTDQYLENSTHELAKLSSLFSAFRKCLKLQTWYHNVLCCL